jgi:hypothetical protein
MGMRRRRRRRRVLAVGAIAHHESVKRSEEETAYAEPAPAPTDHAPPPADEAAELEHLAQLHASGVLTDDEFAAAKAKALT